MSRVQSNEVICSGSENPWLIWMELTIHNTWKGRKEGCHDLINCKLNKRRGGWAKKITRMVIAIFRSFSLARISIGRQPTDSANRFRTMFTKFWKGQHPLSIRFQSVIRCNEEVLHPKGFTFLQRASLTNKIQIKCGTSCARKPGANIKDVLRVKSSRTRRTDKVAN